MRQRCYGRKALPHVPEELRAIEVPAAPGDMQWTGLPEAAALRVSQSEDRLRSRIPRGMPGQSRKWRVSNPDYWKRYREQNPASVEHNRNQQKARDRKRPLRYLANNTSAVDLKHSAAQVWLIGAEAMNLAKRRGILPPSCKQHPSGHDAPTPIRSTTCTVFTGLSTGR